MSTIARAIPKNAEQERINDALREHRRSARRFLRPITRQHYPRMLSDHGGTEFDKMVELSTKMMLVGHACSEIAGRDFNEKRQMMSALFGACCFLGDSFMDDYGPDKTLEYIEALETFLDKGWFPVTNERERLFYIIVSRIFAERDVFDPQTRQAIYGQFLAQKRDALWRLDPNALSHLSSRGKLRALLQCARDRGGFVILVLSLLIVPELSLEHQHLLYLAGELFMHIDDHGDYHQDVFFGRRTYMNSVGDPARTLKTIFQKNIAEMRNGLPDNRGTDLLINFLVRYLHTRLEKKRQEQGRDVARWVIYE